MLRRSLTDIIEQRAISRAPRIEPTTDEPVRAVDVVGRFAAVYRLSVGPAGDWYGECAVALKTGDRWEEAASGGSHGEVGDGDRSQRPPGAACESPLAVVGSAGLDLPNEQDEMVLVRGVYGFATPAVSAIRATQAGRTRVIDVASPAGAFVVVAIGGAEIELQGLDRQGNEIGRPVIRT